MGRSHSPIIYASDDRKEYFEVGEPVRRTLSESMLALLPKTALSAEGDRVTTTAPSLGDAVGLCPDEPFADQPAAAFCSGVLVDWDLVLTAGHCVHQFALDDFVVVFGYYYTSPGDIAVDHSDVFDPIEVVTEAISYPEDEVRLDYAWLRLSAPAAPPRRPAAVYLRDPLLDEQSPIVSIGATGGIPLKVDDGGLVRDARRALTDYFIVDSDTVKGSSGGPALDEKATLLGVLARGGPDWADTASGCLTAVYEPDRDAAQEHFTYAYRAVEALCAADGVASSLCDSECEEPCRAALPQRGDRNAGCAISTTRRAPSAIWSAGLLLMWRSLRRARRKGKRARSTAAGALAA